MPLFIFRATIKKPLKISTFPPQILTKIRNRLPEKRPYLKINRIHLFLWKNRRVKRGKQEGFVEIPEGFVEIPERVVEIPDKVSGIPDKVGGIPEAEYF